MDNQKMGQFILGLRKAKGMTQKELAGELHVTDKAVSKWERGISCPDIALLPELANVLGVTVSELLNGEKSNSDAANKVVSVDNALQYAEKTAKGRMNLWQNVFAMLGPFIPSVQLFMSGLFYSHLSNGTSGELYGVYLL